jgi:hypothetical protein
MWRGTDICGLAGPTFNHISRILTEHNINSVGLVVNFFWPAMDVLGLKTLGAYSVPCECG